MYRWLSRSVAAVVAAGTATGCANVKVEKVSVADRAEGRDDHVNGFRYYLTRPYLMVAKRVPVTTSYVPVAFAAQATVVKNLKAGDLLPANAEVFLVSLVPDRQTGQFTVYDPSGHPRPDVSARELTAIAGGGTNTDAGGGAAGLDAAEVFIANKVFNSMTAASKPDNKLLEGDEQTPVIKGRLRAAARPGLATNVAADERRKKGVSAAIAVANEMIASTAGVKEHFAEGAKIPGDEAAINVVANDMTFPPLGGSTQVAVAKKGLQLLRSGEAAARAKAATAEGGEAGAEGGAGDTTPPFQVAYLPDFEEQYAIKNCNFLAKTKYQYRFRNGTELQSAAGAYDATDLPVKVIETVGALVNAAASVAKTRINPGGAAALGLTSDTGVQADFYIKVELAIEPGVYRVQKSWERAAATAAGLSADQVGGLFGDIGLPLVASQAVITASDYAAEHPN